jgi:hypothetical protein
MRPRTLQWRTLPATLRGRTNRYLSSLIAQAHRRVSPLPGFTRFAHAATTIAGLALVHPMQKQPFTGSALSSATTRIPHVWEAVLAA